LKPVLAFLDKIDFLSLSGSPVAMFADTFGRCLCRRPSLFFLAERQRPLTASPPGARLEGLSPEGGPILGDMSSAMAGVYRARHPERSVLYLVLFHHFERFLAEYDSRFELEHGFLRPIVKEVVERYLDCGNPRCGFARIRCPACQEERLVMLSCRTRGFCPSCHAKRLEDWGEWML
jgi:ribosomal protein S27E